MEQGDLSNFHYPLSGLSAGAVENTRLTPDKVQFFNENGFLSGIPLLGPEQVEILNSELRSLMEDGQGENPLFYEYHRNESSDPDKILFHALGAWRVSKGFHDLIFLRPIVDAAERLLGGPVRFWHDQLFVKPPREGGVVEWHQDYSYWTRTVPMAHLTCWIGLDDSTEENGCVRYVPGSHKWDLLPRVQLSGTMSEIFEYLSVEQRAKFKPLPAVMKAGSGSFHHPLMVHGSYANTSARPRRAAVLNFIRDGVRSDSNEPLLDGVPAVPMGQKLDGRFFPLLSRESF